MTFSSTFGARDEKKYIFVSFNSKKESFVYSVEEKCFGNMGSVVYRRLSTNVNFKEAGKLQGIFLQLRRINQYSGGIQTSELQQIYYITNRVQQKVKLTQQNLTSLGYIVYKPRQ